nr:reverse transcriptase domain-containing protein [Tanacetum cinerariifolium]
DNEESNFDNPSFPRPPLEPPDAKFDFEPNSGEEILVMIDELECLDPRDVFDDDNYSSFMFLICSKMFLSFLSAESEDTIFDPGRKPSLSFMRLFGCPVTILHTIDHLGKFDRKADKGFFVGYATNSKAFRVIKSRTRIVEENLHVKFSKTTWACPHHGFSELHQLDTFYNALNVNDQDSLNSAAGGNFLDKMPHECLKIIKRKFKVRQSRAKAVVAKVSTSSSTPAISSEVAELKDMLSQIMLLAVALTRTKILPLPAETFIETTSRRSGTLPSNTITNPKEDLKGITTRSSVAYQGPTIPTPFKVVKQGTEPVVAPVSTLMPNLKPSIPYPLRRDIERHPLIGNKEKLSEMVRTLMNEHCSVVILNKLPRKLGDPGKFLIPCEFLGMDECLALADLGASINLMPLSMWEGLSLPELTPTCMTLELADRSVSKPIGIAKYVSVKVGVFHFPTDFVVLDFKPDPRVPLILGRCFLKIGRALIDVHKGELTLRIKNEATRKDHFPLPFMDQILERLARNEYYCFLDGFFGFSDAENDDSGTNMNNLDTYFQVSLVPTTRIHKDHPLNQVIGDLIEAIRLFLAYASFKEFMVYEIDVKIAFLYVKIEEEVYVCQPSGFEDPDFPDRVYKVEKALYRLHQAPRAWNYALSLKRSCIRSSMRQLTFFLGLQVKQKKDRIFISQDYYVNEILNKFGFSDVKTASTPMETQKPLLKDKDGVEVDCARFQVNPKTSHLHDVKRIFRYLKGQPKLGVWYPKDSPFDLVAYTDSDYARASLDRKSTTGEVNVVYDTPFHTKKIFANMRRQGKDFLGTVTPLLSSMIVQQADIDETVTKEWEDKKEKAATTASSLAAEQDSGNINMTQSMATLNEISPQGTGSGSGRRCQDTILGDADAQIDRLSNGDYYFEGVKKIERKRQSRTPGKNLFKIGTSRRRSLGEDNASKQGRNLKKRKQIFKECDFDDESFDADMDHAIKDVKGDAKHVINAAADEVSTGDAVNTTGTEVNTASAPVTTAGISVSTAEPITSISEVVTTAEPNTPPTITVTVFEDEDLTIAQTLVKMKSKKSKERGVVMNEPSETATRPTLSPQKQDPKDKEEEERLAKQREEDTNIAEYDNVQAMIDAVYELAARLQEEEQGELTVEDKSIFFVEKAFDKTMSWIDSFVPMDSKVVKDRAEGSETRAEGGSKRAGEDLQQESTKK